jgi:NitT/TauT family transport system permease protein
MSALRSYMPGRPSLRRSASLLDVIVLVAVVVLLYSVLRIGHGTTARLNSQSLNSKSFSTDPSHLPYDAARSLLRMFIALFFSVLFTFTYGYAAARSRRAEKILVPILDVLQSVPVLGFLTITVTLFLGIFPHSELGLECASIFAIFTSQAWNMTFAFYASLKGLPKELDELSRSMRLTRWQRYWKIEVPNAAIGQVWNGMMSFGGSWFFLVASEMITVKGTNYALPGIGSYAGAAINDGQIGRVLLAIGVMIFMVVAVNFCFWRPLVAYCERYRFETSAANEAPRSLVLDFLNRSHWPRAVGRLRVRLAEPLGRMMVFLGRDGTAPAVSERRRRAGDVLLSVAVLALIGYGAYQGLHYLAVTPGAGLKQIPKCLLLGLATFGRVILLVIFATIVWVPVGVWIGMNPRVSRVAQPIVQVFASFPANFLFPFAVAIFLAVGLSLNIGGILLMALGAQWYILFNVIAGASAIPTDLREAMDVLDVSGWQRWKRLIMPGILSSYVTGGITAAGGAWNASIVAEVVNYDHHHLVAYGLGAYIVHASAIGNKADLICGIVVMSLFVVGANRFFWRRLYRLAESRYSL